MDRGGSWRAEFFSSLDLSAPVREGEACRERGSRRALSRMQEKDWGSPRAPAPAPDGCRGTQPRVCTCSGWAWDVRCPRPGEGARWRCTQQGRFRKKIFNLKSVTLTFRRQSGLRAILFP